MTFMFQKRIFVMQNKEILKSYYVTDYMPMKPL